MVRATLTTEELEELMDGSTINIITTTEEEIELSPMDFEDEQLEMLQNGETLEIVNEDGDEIELNVEIE